MGRIRGSTDARGRSVPVHDPPSQRQALDPWGRHGHYRKAAGQESIDERNREPSARLLSSEGKGGYCMGRPAQDSGSRWSRARHVRPAQEGVC